MLLSCCNVIVLIADWRFVFVLCRVYQFANTQTHKHKHTEKHPATPDVPVQGHHQATVECFGSFCMEMLEAAIFKPALLRPGPKSLGIWLVTLNLSKMNYLSDGLARLDNIPTLTGKFLKAPLSLNLVPLLAPQGDVIISWGSIADTTGSCHNGEDYRDQHVIISRGSIAVAKLIVSNMLPPINRIMWSTFVSGANICNWPSQKTSSRWWIFSSKILPPKSNMSSKILPGQGLSRAACCRQLTEQCELKEAASRSYSDTSWKGETGRFKAQCYWSGVFLKRNIGALASQFLPHFLPLQNLHCFRWAAL